MKTTATRVGLSYALALRYFGFYRSIYSCLQFSRTATSTALRQQNQEVSPESKRGPLVAFARFVDGQVVLFCARTEEIKYVAVSHVWGQAEWQQIKVMQGDLLASREKATFISERLPQLLDGLAFWMDVICVNQRNRTEVTAIVQSIPDIFRDASRTLVIRECDGLYNCCTTLVDGFTSRRDFVDRLAQHAWDHYKHKYDESYLQRLWTLQECLLSHTLQFVLCGSSE